MLFTSHQHQELEHFLVQTSDLIIGRHYGGYSLNPTANAKEDVTILVCEITASFRHVLVLNFGEA